MKDIKYLRDNGVDVNQSLELLGDLDTYNEMIKDFKASLKEKKAQIEKYFDDKDMPNYAVYVHSLKSDCKYFGFLNLANIAYQHELKSKDNDYEYVKENFEPLMEEVRKVQGIVDNYLGNAEETAGTYGNGEVPEGNEEIEELGPEKPEDIILVADDSEVIRIFVKKIFDVEYELAFAADGIEALTIIQNHEKDGRIKAILLDLNMPRKDGFAVLDYMQEHSLLGSMPVTVISGDQSSDAINKAFNYNIVDMLSKPFNEQKIKDAVEKTINSAK